MENEFRDMDENSQGSVSSTGSIRSDMTDMEPGEIDSFIDDDQSMTSNQRAARIRITQKLQNETQQKLEAAHGSATKKNHECAESLDSLSISGESHEDRRLVLPMGVTYRNNTEEVRARRDEMVEVHLERMNSVMTARGLTTFAGRMTPFKTDAEYYVENVNVRNFPKEDKLNERDLQIPQFHKFIDGFAHPRFMELCSISFSKAHLQPMSETDRVRFYNTKARFTPNMQSFVDFELRREIMHFDYQLPELYLPAMKRAQQDHTCNRNPYAFYKAIVFTILCALGYDPRKFVFKQQLAMFEKLDSERIELVHQKMRLVDDITLKLHCDDEHFLGWLFDVFDRFFWEYMLLRESRVWNLLPTLLQNVPLNGQLDANAFLTIYRYKNYKLLEDKRLGGNNPLETIRFDFASYRELWISRERARNPSLFFVTGLPNLWTNQFHWPIDDFLMREERLTTTELAKTIQPVDITQEDEVSMEEMDATHTCRHQKMLSNWYEAL